LFGLVFCCEGFFMEAHIPDNRVWVVTGASRGFGRELVRAALARGDCVVATSREPEKVMADCDDASDRLVAMPMDLRDFSQIVAMVDSAVGRFGRIDVLVNNAGYGLIGAVEEATDAEILNVFETNVFGLVRVTRAVLPHMRGRRGGAIVNLSSIGGLVGLAGSGIYNATKFAVEGLSEALAKEVGPLGIRVMIVEPGPFRTDFLGGSLAKTGMELADYAHTAGEIRAAAEKRNGAQPGDPVRGAEAIIHAVVAEKTPLHLVLGEAAYRMATEKFEGILADMKGWEELGLSTDYPKAPQAETLKAK
jgi:NAD(P)-dependent dehydrogenase (short-subunit alcohol dehydrogenase family)